MDTISQSPHGLNSLVIAGKLPEAFEKYYDDDVVMQENNGDPVIGKESTACAKLNFPTT